MYIYIIDTIIIAKISIYVAFIVAVSLRLYAFDLFLQYISLLKIRRKIKCQLSNVREKLR